MFDDQPGSALDALIAELRRLPGVGAKSAQRYAQHIMRAPREEGLRLARAIETALDRVRPCSVCHDLADIDPCPICRDPARSAREICVVEDPWSVRRIERTGAFRGRYHVLHGALSPMRGIGPDELPIPSLLRRVASGEIVEVILATSPTADGEATASQIADALKGRVKVTRIAYGLPVGSDLEAVDEVTIARALDGRREMA